VEDDPPFNPWAFIRDAMIRGAAIAKDFESAGYEKYSARMDAVARELADEFCERIAEPDDAPAEFHVIWDYGSGSPRSHSSGIETFPTLKDAMDCIMERHWQRAREAHFGNHPFTGQGITLIQGRELPIAKLKEGGNGAS
jgi:hypothetical protein